jgi:hypothetical protein
MRGQWWRARYYRPESEDNIREQSWEAIEMHNAAMQAAPPPDPPPHTCPTRGSIAETEANPELETETC